MALAALDWRPATRAQQEEEALEASLAGASQLAPLLPNPAERCPAQ